MRPPSRHTKFFSSLKQVEKRLILEEEIVSLPPPQLPHLSSSLHSSTSTDDLIGGSPIYLNCHSQLHKTISSIEDSGPPSEFLSASPQFLPIQRDPSQPKPFKRNDNVDEGEGDEGKDDVEKLIELLGLLEFSDESELEWGSCHCDDGFYSKIVGAKGPKCEKEVKRLDGWIEYFVSDDNGGVREMRETLRIGHLLLGRAAAVLARDENRGDFGEIEFPSTIQEFLEHDPPNLHSSLHFAQQTAIRAVGSSLGSCYVIVLRVLLPNTIVLVGSLFCLKKNNCKVENKLVASPPVERINQKNKSISVIFDGD